MDFYPLAGKCQGGPIDLSDLHTDTDYSIDFNGRLKGQAKVASYIGAPTPAKDTIPVDNCVNPRAQKA